MNRTTTYSVPTTAGTIGNDAASSALMTQPTKTDHPYDKHLYGKHFLSSLVSGYKLIARGMSLLNERIV